jgi:hypothetical protein
MPISSRHGDEALDFFRRTAGHIGGDLHLHIGHVGKRIDRQLARRVQPECEQAERDHDDHEALFERPAYQAFNHDSSNPVAGEDTGSAGGRTQSVSLRLRSLFR